MLLTAPLQLPLQLLLAGGQGGGVAHRLLTAQGHAQGPAGALQVGLGGTQQGGSLLHSALRDLRFRGPEFFQLSSLGLQSVIQPLGPLQPGVGHRLPLPQVQGPGQGGGAAKQILHLGGEGVDEVK